MSSIKLTADSGGGTFELKAPASGSNARVLTVPDTANGTVLTTTNPKAGNIVQIVQAETSSEVTTSSTTYVDSGLSGTITTTGSNKVLIIVNQQYRVFRNISQALGGIRLMRGSTVVDEGPNNASGAQPFGIGVINTSSDNHLYGRHVMTYLDSPSAGTHTYKTQMALTTALNSATFRAQYQANGENGKSIITLMEVAV
tara:strand:+ start:256 stop:852 length:597 start_codon:yes stop_codon:yes gene_type:complete